MPKVQYQHLIKTKKMTRPHKSDAKAGNTMTFTSRAVISKFGARSGTRTRKDIIRWILSPQRLPISPSGLI